MSILHWVIFPSGHNYKVPLSRSLSYDSCATCFPRHFSDGSHWELLKCFSEFFSGIELGCPDAPALFCCAIQWCGKVLHDSCDGVNILLFFTICLFLQCLRSWCWQKNKNLQDYFFMQTSRTLVSLSQKAELFFGKKCLICTLCYAAFFSSERIVSAVKWNWSLVWSLILDIPSAWEQLEKQANIWVLQRSCVFGSFPWFFLWSSNFSLENMRN